MDTTTEKYFELGHKKKELGKERYLRLNKKITFIDKSRNSEWNYLNLTPSTYKNEYNSIDYIFPSLIKEYDYLEISCLLDEEAILISILSKDGQKEESLKVTKDNVNTISGSLFILEIFEMDLLDSFLSFSEVIFKNGIIGADKLLDFFGFLAKSRFIPRIVEISIPPNNLPFDQEVLLQSEEVRIIVSRFLCELSGRKLDLVYNPDKELISLTENGIEKYPTNYNSIVFKTLAFLPQILFNILKGNIVVFREEYHKWFYVLPVEICSRILKKISEYCTKEYPQFVMTVSNDIMNLEKPGFNDMIKDYKSITRTIPSP